MKETSSSEKFLLKHFGKKDISVELQNLSEDKLSSLEIKEANFDRAIKYKNGKTTLKETLNTCSITEKREFIPKLITSMLKRIDSSAVELKEVKEMKASESMVSGAWANNAYSATLKDYKLRRATLKHLLEQLL